MPFTRRHKRKNTSHTMPVQLCAPNTPQHRGMHDNAASTIAKSGRKSNRLPCCLHRETAAKEAASKYIWKCRRGERGPTMVAISRALRRVERMPRPSPVRAELQAGHGLRCCSEQPDTTADHGIGRNAASPGVETVLRRVDRCSASLRDETAA